MKCTAKKKLYFQYIEVKVGITICSVLLYCNDYVNSGDTATTHMCIINNLPIINLLVGSEAKFLSAVAADLTTVS